MPKANNQDPQRHALDGLRDQSIERIEIGFLLKQAKPPIYAVEHIIERAYRGTRPNLANISNLSPVPSKVLFKVPVPFKVLLKFFEFLAFLRRRWDLLCRENSLGDYSIDHVINVPDKSR